MSSGSGTAADHARFQRDYAVRVDGALVEPASSPDDDAFVEVGSAGPSSPPVDDAAAGRHGIDIRWIVALLATGVVLMVGAALLYKAGWLAQGSGKYAVDSYGEVYSAEIGRTLDDIVYEDFLFTVNPYLFALGGLTVLGTLFLIAARGVRRRDRG